MSLYSYPLQQNNWEKNQYMYYFEYKARYKKQFF